MITISLLAMALVGITEGGWSCKMLERSSVQEPIRRSLISANKLTKVDKDFEVDPVKLNNDLYQHLRFEKLGADQQSDNEIESVLSASETVHMDHPEAYVSKDQYKDIIKKAKRPNILSRIFKGSRQAPTSIPYTKSEGVPLPGYKPLAPASPQEEPPYNLKAKTV